MSKKLKEEFSTTAFFFILATVVLIVAIFTIIDYFVHSSNPAYAVPSYYFRNKVIFGIIWGLVFYYLLKNLKVNLGIKTLMFSALIAIVLQVRYAFEGYPLDFVIDFLFYHFLMLWASSYLLFKIMRKKVKF